MRRVLLVALTAACLGAAQSVKLPDDAVLKAMIDELQRIPMLAVVGLEDKPYFAEYSLEDVNSFSAAASLGSLMGSSRTHGRLPQVAVRTGSYEFDNTNHVQTTQQAGPRLDGEWPIENDYGVLRQNFWLATDRAFKNALEAISRKRSSLRNAAAPEKLADFSKAPPTVFIGPLNREPFDEKVWTKRAVDLSAIFSAYPEIFTSSADTSIYLGNSYYVNIEGSIQRTPETLVQVRSLASAQAPDGMTIHDARIFASLSLQSVPSDLDFRRGVTEVADNIRALLKAPAGEDYTGPVLFEAQAAAQLIAQLVGDNLRLTRRPVSDPGRPAQTSPGELEGRVASRILPEWMSIVDDPTQTEWHGEHLVGGYRFDMEGIAPQPVSVVEKGVLKNFLLTRQPVGAYATTNGHARLPGPYGAHMATISNLFISASEGKPLGALKAQLIDICKQRNKPFGMLVRKLDYPSSASVPELQSLAAGMTRGGGSRPVTPPILVYRVYQDGREELVRGLRFRGLNVRSLRDIIAASSESTVFHFINNGAPFAMIGAGGFLAPASVISPALLFEELEFERPQDNLSQPPLVPPPPLTSAVR